MTQKTWYVIAAVVVVILVGLGIWWYQMQPNTSSNYSSPTTSSTDNNGTDSSGTATTGSNGTTTTASLTYNEALNLYKDRRVQFGAVSDGYCNMTPDSVVYKKGTTIMLDNRINKALSVSLSGTVYNLKAYGFAIVTLSTSQSLPYKISVSCGGGKNNGTITLE